MKTKGLSLKALIKKTKSEKTSLKKPEKPSFKLHSMQFTDCTSAFAGTTTSLLQNNPTIRSVKSALSLAQGGADLRLRMDFEKQYHFDYLAQQTLQLDLKKIK